MKLIWHLLETISDSPSLLRDGMFHYLQAEPGGLRAWLEPENAHPWTLEEWRDRAPGWWIYVAWRHDTPLETQAIVIVDWGAGAPPLLHFWCKPDSPPRLVASEMGRFYHAVMQRDMQSIQVNPGPGSFAWRVTERLGGQPTADGRGLILSPERFNHGWWRRIQTQAPEARAEAGAGDHGGR